MRQLRVIHLSPTWFGDTSVRGGGERYPLELARAMARQTPTRLISFGQHSAIEMVDGFEIEIHRTWRNLRSKQSDPIGPGFITPLMWADVVHCHQVRTGLTALATVLARTFRKRVFVTDHGGGGVNWVRRLRIGQWIDGQLAQSAFAAGTLPYIGHRTKIIFAGVDEDKYSPRSTKVLGRVVFVGRLLPHKGIEFAIRGLPPAASLEIYGRPYDADYLQFLKTEASSRAVTFHTQASDNDVIAALTSACAFVMPSVYDDYRGRHQSLPELVGLAPIEAMSCGTAVVVSDVAGMPEIMPPDSGVTVPPGDPDAIQRAVEPLTTSIKHATSQGVAARAHVLNSFTWSAVADRCLEAYRA